MREKKGKEVELDICVFYLCVHKRINDKVDLNRVMNRQEFYKILGEVYHIPKALRVVILKEMVELKMIKELEQNNIIQVLPLLLDPELNINKYYNQLGLW